MLAGGRLGGYSCNNFQEFSVLKTASISGFCFNVLLGVFGWGGVAFGQAGNPGPVAASEPLEIAARRVFIVEPSGGQANERDAEQQLVNANFQHINDSQGFRWDVHSSYATIDDGTNDCFDGGFYLYVNNSRFRAKSQKMTADGLEYVLAAPMGSLEVTRRVYVNTELAAVRYLEVIRNTHESKQDVTVEIRSDLGSTPQRTVTSTNKPMGGKLGKEDVGVYAVSRGGSRPSVAFLLSGTRRDVHRPTITVSGDDVVARWQIELPAKEAVVLLHGAAQRRGAAVEAAFEGLYDRGFLHPQVPEELRDKVINFRLSRRIDGTMPLNTVARLAEAHGLQRGDRDALRIDADTVIRGSARAERLSIATAFGETEVAWEDVAAVVGGGGVDATMHLFLRSGEVFHGPISADALALSNPDGIDMKLDPAKLELLLARKHANDNRVPGDTRFILTTREGLRLLVADFPDAVLEGATPWGSVEVPLEKVASFFPSEASDFAHRVLLSDGARLSLIPQASPIVLRTHRFGTVSLPASRVERIGRLADAPEEGGDADQQEEGPSLIAETPTPPHVTLLGENVLPGRLAFEALTLRHDKGEERLQARQVQRIEIERPDDIVPTFLVELRSGKKFEGQLDRATFRIESSLRSWTVPVSHLQAYEAGDPPPQPEAAPGTSDPARASEEQATEEAGETLTGQTTPDEPKPQRSSGEAGAAEPEASSQGEAGQ